jgi:spermidine/putrescine ABC transporter ATP-binding subunit
MGNRTLRGAPISFVNLVKAYGSASAVDNLTLDIASGEFVSLLGPSGSGKTTTLMMVAGFTAPTSGKILLGGNDITHLAPYRRDIGMVHQSYALFPHMTVAKNVAFPLRMRGMSRKVIDLRVEAALELVHLRGLRDRLPTQLSGGQQQRVALARALVFEPPLLLMDEPLGALDKKLRVELQIEIRRIQREIGSTMLYVTHDQEEALSMSDRVVVMNNGKVEQFDKPLTMYERPNTAFVANFLGTTNTLEAVVVGAADHVNVRTAGGLKIDVATRASYRPGDRLTLSIRPERIRLTVHGAAPAATAFGTIAEASYFGNVQRYVVSLTNGEALIVTRPSTGDPMLDVATPVDLAWNASDIWVIPAP